MESMGRTINITTQGDYKISDNERLRTTYNNFVDRAMKADQAGDHDEATQLYHLAISVLTWMQQLSNKN